MAALTTLFLTFFAIRFDVFDGTLGRTLVGNLASIGFGQLPGGDILFWAYQLLAVALLAAASMTAFQDAQATEWRDVAIGEIPEFIVYRDQARHLHPIGYGHLCRGRSDHVFGAGSNDRGRALLWRGCVYADLCDGPGDSQAYAAEFHRLEADLGRVWRRLCRFAGRHGFCWTDRGQVGRRRLDSADHFDHARYLGALVADLAVRLPQSQTDSSASCATRRAFRVRWRPSSNGSR